jgi:hypothetical protein
VSRYDLFRRRIAPIAFFLAIALIARDSCDKAQRTHAAIELDFGGARPRVTAVDVRVVAGGETVTTFQRRALGTGGIGPCRFDAVLPGEDGELQIEIDLGDDHRQLSRSFHTVEGATVRVPVGDALAAPPATR